MKTRARIVRSLMTMALAAGGISVATASPASAAPAKAAACYDVAVSYSTTQYGAQHEWPATGYARTSSSCADINVRPNSTISVRTCFRATASCNSWRTISGGTWGLAATDVLDGTDYWLVFSAPSSGRVAD
ncbi:hypothetical protein [Streptomyces sp. NPDC006784]|uniref:hypothetical protein n=1 Tax=Streptomyces sp. NPDC006784 TaxID=3364764 RepID=UPI0036B89753